MVRPLLLAYFRSNSTVRGGSFKVTDIVASGISTGRSSWEASSKYRYAWRSDKSNSRDRRRTASGSATPRCSRPRAAFMWRAFCALVERAIRHKYITVYDGGQAVHTFLATLRLFLRTENYLLCKGRGQSAARQPVHEPFVEGLAEYQAGGAIPSSRGQLCG